MAVLLLQAVAVVVTFQVREKEGSSEGSRHAPFDFSFGGWDRPNYSFWAFFCTYKNLRDCHADCKAQWPKGLTHCSQRCMLYSTSSSKLCYFYLVIVNIGFWQSTSISLLLQSKFERMKKRGRYVPLHLQKDRYKARRTANVIAGQIGQDLLHATTFEDGLVNLESWLKVYLAADPDLLQRINDYAIINDYANIMSSFSGQIQRTSSSGR